jgi:hypothetical protein
MERVLKPFEELLQVRDAALQEVQALLRRSVGPAQPRAETLQHLLSSTSLGKPTRQAEDRPEVRSGVPGPGRLLQLRPA